MSLQQNPLAQLAAWLLAADQPHESDTQVQERRPTLPPVEQLEQRLYLGGMASSSLADFAPPDDQAASKPEVAVLWVNEDEAPAASNDQQLVDEPVVPPSQPNPRSNPSANQPTTVQPGVSPEAPLLGNALGDLFEALPQLNFASEPLPETSLTESALGEASRSQLANDGGIAAEARAGSGGAIEPADAKQLAASQVLANQVGEQTAQANSGPALEQQVMNVQQAQLNSSEVGVLLERASRASLSNDAIIAVVDRHGRILGVRVEQDVIDTLDPETLVFAIDGAVAKARTAALFSNGEFTGSPDDSLAPLTSRTVRFISQSTNTQREVESNPNIVGADIAATLASTTRGPGFVAPIGVGGHFPPEVMFTPPVDLFAIEHTNRDSNLHPGADGIRGQGVDFTLRTSGTDSNGETLGRFNIDPSFVAAVPPGSFAESQALYAPESYGNAENSGALPNAQSRGIATLPGGIPLFRDANHDGLGDTLVGGIGVFFPGEDGFATHEQGFVAGIGQTEAQRTNAPRVLEAEFIALAAAGGSQGATPWFPAAKVGDIGGVAPVSGLDLPFGRLDLVGITLEVIGPGSNSTGIRAVLDRGAEVGAFTGANSGVNVALNNAFNEAGVFSANGGPVTAPTGGTLRNGKVVPDGYLVEPQTSMVDPTLTADRVRQIIDQAIAAANETRAAVRLPLSSRTKMVFAVADSSGEILGLFRMPNATTFSIDVAVAKARNTAYYADGAALQPEDQVAGVAAGTAFTNRTFRFLAEPRFPSGIDGTPPPAFSILNDGNIDPLTGENLGAPDPVSAFTSVKGDDAFFAMGNFRDPGDATVMAAGGQQNLANQNGVVFFPGSTPLYVNGQLVGGFGVSGDGVDQDDVVTFLGAQGFLPDSTIPRADQQIVNGVRLPFQKFLRNPFG